jgi:hypothetical protein
MRVRGSGAFAVALGVTLLLLLVGVPLASALGGLYEASLEGWQLVEVEVEVVDESGAPAGPAHVAAFELADGGPKLLAEGRASLSGVFKFGAKVPRRLIAELENGTRVYAPLNLWIIAWREDNLLATLTQPIDITTMKHPLDTIKLRVQARRIAQTATKESAATASDCYLPAPYLEEAWAWTTVLQFSTWDNISAKYYYPPGSQVYVEGKERVWLVSECRYTSDWYRGGGSIVVLEAGRESDWLQGRKIFSLQLYFKYYFYRYTPPHQSTFQVEKIYAVDTNNDPWGSRRVESDWNGQLPGWSTWQYVSQGETGIFDITGSAPSLSFSVGASVSFKIVGVSVSVGTSRASPPNGALYVRAGSWLPGYMVKVEATDTSYVNTRSNWSRP